MTGRTDFTEEEWELVTAGPAAAGMIVITAAEGGTFRETFALAKAYAEARQQFSESELLDGIVSAGPAKGDRYDSDEELRDEGLRRLRDAVDLLERKATAEELEDYRAFVLDLANKVAQAHEEKDEKDGGRERVALEEIAASLGLRAR